MELEAERDDEAVNVEMLPVPDADIEYGVLAPDIAAVADQEMTPAPSTSEAARVAGGGSGAEVGLIQSRNSYQAAMQIFVETLTVRVPRVHLTPAGFAVSAAPAKRPPCMRPLFGRPLNKACALIFAGQDDHP